MIRAIFFDLDGTLIPRGALWLRCLEGFMADHGESGEAIPSNTVVHLIPQIVAEPRVNRMGVARALASLYPGLGWSPARILADLDQRLPSCVRPDPRVIAMVESLSGRFRLGLITNGSGRIQRGKLANSGLADFFEGAYVSGEIGVRKPSREIFQRALDAAAVAPEEALMVGDDLEEDIQGAFDAGLLTCGVGVTRDRTTDRPPPHFSVHQITDLPGILP